MAISRNRKHGGAGARYSDQEPLFKIWRSIRSRCYQKSARCYPRYGGRGISLAECWHDYAKFREDLMPLYVTGLQIDRIDNEKGYEPGNIKWSTRKEQCRNRRSNRLITAFGKTQTLQAWADERGVPWFRIATRIRVCGWSPEDAITKPPRPWSPGRKKTTSLA